MEVVKDDQFPDAVQIPEFSEQGKRQNFGALKELVSRSSNTDASRVPLIALHGGLPPIEAFPIKSITVELTDGKVVSLPASIAQQQYNIAPTGYPPLEQWCEQHINHYHSPPAQAQHRVLVTDSSTHALEILSSLFLNPGDALLVEEYTYPHYLEAIARVNGYTIIPMAMDAAGIIPTALETLLKILKKESNLQNDDTDQGQRSPFPKLLYTIPIGQNPTSATTPPDRKHQIYNLCREYSIFIVEDDPYCLLQFPLDPGSPMPGLYGAELHSYLSMDVDGRVCRLDSFAKCFAPGLRIGFATAPAAVAEKMTMAIQAHSVGANMISQTLLAEILIAWGEEGFHQHLIKTQQVYSEQATALVTAMEEEMKGLAEWEAPSAGMFLWVKLLTVEDSMELMPELMGAGVVVVPGSVAAAARWTSTTSTSCEADAVGNKTLSTTGERRVPCSYIRISFSNASPSDLEEGVRRIAAVLRARKK